MLMRVLVINYVLMNAKSSLLELPCSYMLCVYFRYLTCKRNSSKQMLGTCFVIRLVVRMSMKISILGQICADGR